MGRGRDLTTTERAMVHSKIKIFWDYENKKIKHGKVFEIRKLSAQSGVPCSDKTVKRIASEMKLQEQKNDEVFAESGQVSGLDFTPSKKEQRPWLLFFAKISSQSDLHSLYKP